MSSPRNDPTVFRIEPFAFIRGERRPDRSISIPPCATFEKRSWKSFRLRDVPGCHERDSSE